MKRFFAITVLTFGSLVAFSLGACSKSTGASSDMNTSCYLAQTQGFNTAAGSGSCTYNYQATPGFTNYSSTSIGGFASFGGGLGCGGQTAVYSPSKGLGCLNSGFLGTVGVPAIYAVTGGGTFQCINCTGVAGYPAQIGAFGGYNTGSVLRACDANEGCPDGQSCRAPSGVSPYGLGVCYLN